MGSDGVGLRPPGADRPIHQGHYLPRGNAPKTR